MTINRNNYESFFLLAVDNELSALERNMLEEFLKYNTDLQKEFSLLQKSILPVEEVVFKSKTSLLKQESISAAIEEKILLFIDNELGEKEAGDFILVTKNDDRISAEIQLLHQTKLLPDTKIIFANKQLLYKRDAGKVIPFSWLKFAAAAVFIGVGIFGAIKYLPFANKGLIKDVAIKTTPGKVSKQLAKINPTATLPQETISAKSSTLTEDQIIAKTIVKPSLEKNKKQVNLKEDKNFAAEQKLNKPDNNLPKPYYEKTSNKTVDNSPLNTIDKSSSSNTAFNNDNSNKTVKITDAAIENKVYTTSFSDNKDADKKDQFTFSDEEEGPKKSRLSGFLRKAKRVLERSTKIKSGNENLKVANFEFATQ